MRQITLVALVTLFVLPLTLFAAADSGLTTQILSATSTRTVVSAEIDPVALAAHLQQLEPGGHALDGYGTFLAIAGHGTPQAEVTRYQLGEIVQTTQSLTPQDIATTPNELVIVGEPAVLHDLRLVSVNYRPMMQDADGAIHTVLSLEATVTTSGSGVNEIDDPVTFSGAFDPVYRSAVSNLDELYPERSLDAPGRFIVIGTTRRLEAAGDLGASNVWRNWMDLKRRKGYNLQIASLRTIHEAVGDSSQNGIKQYLQAAYNDHSQGDLEYVMIIGDAGEIPTYQRNNPEVTGESAVGDNLYFTLAGGDLLPDVLHGRVSGSSSSEYVAYFAKVNRYETSPYLDDTSWFQKAASVAGNFADGGGNPVTPVWNGSWARERLMRDGTITRCDTFFWHGPNDPAPGQYEQWIADYVNTGVTLLMYRGWAGSQGWQYPVFRNYAVDNLVNCGNRNPAVFAVVCGSGNFNYNSGQCLGEKFTTGCGSASESNGAIIYFGASDLHTNTRHNNAVLAGMLEAALTHGVRSGSALALAGKLEGWRQFPLEHEGENGPESALAFYYIWHVLNLLGDPETQLYIGLPGTFTANVAASLPVGQNLVPVTVSSGGQAVNNAVVTLRQQGTGTTIATTRSDRNGVAYLPASFSGAGTAQLSIWKSGYIMKWQDIPIASQAYDPKITTTNWTAGSDNLPNPGEAVTFTLAMLNAGTDPTTLTATVTSLDPRISVTNGSGSVATMAAGGTATSTSFSITLGAELFDGELPRLAVQFTDGANTVVRNIEVPVAAPDPTVISLRVADGNNGILEASDGDVPVYVTAQNVGGQDAANLTVTLDSFDNAVSFTGATATWSALAHNQTAESNTPFTARLAAGVTPGRQVLLHLVFSQNGVVVARKEFLMPTGVVTTTAPTGPDAYGYYAYENIDAGFAATPTYNWIELDPAHGGTGAAAHEVHDDTHFGMALPAAFTYYGQSYDSVWICSNGWLSFARATIPEFRNWEVPSPIGPGALVAAFWDDLVGKSMSPVADTVFTVWTRHDASENRFIVEWRCFNRRGASESPGVPNTAICIFEIILEYAASGDGSILLQYNAVGNVDTRDNFATVGIEDLHHNRGLNLTYARAYPASCDSLWAGRAIRFTTRTPDAFSGVGDDPQSVLPKQFALYDPSPNPFNPTTELRFDLPVSGQVALRVYDMLGREVATLVDGVQTAGTYRVSFDGHELASGLYFARLTSGANTQVRKLMLVK
jgi:hypothetical protein